jgi:hypothetical protein
MCSSRVVCDPLRHHLLVLVGVRFDRQAGPGTLRVLSSLNGLDR